MRAFESAVVLGRVGERGLESACVPMCSRRADDKAGTHLSVVGVDFGHFD